MRHHADEHAGRTVTARQVRVCGRGRAPAGGLLRPHGRRCAEARPDRSPRPHGPRRLSVVPGGATVKLGSAVSGTAIPDGTVTVREASRVLCKTTDLTGTPAEPATPAHVTVA
ncbi:hypothetical protein [Streptomyces sp. NPDC057460]|uniref:hypothetical protein n=1 Tax=Streptomyces sp. NPDC057460 TaxID=3346141 RepID=UPI00367FBDCC